MTRLIVQVIVPLSVLLPIIAGIYYYSRISAGVRMVLLYLAIAALFNFTAILFSRQHINNMPLLHIYTAVEFACCALFFRHAFKGSRLYRYILPLIAGFTLFCILNAIFFQNIFSLNSYSRSIEAAILIVFCLFLFYKLLRVTTGTTKDAVAFQWIGLGFFFYFSGSLFLFLFPAFNHADPAVYRLGWIVHSSLVLLMYVLFSVAFHFSARMP